MKSDLRHILKKFAEEVLENVEIKDWNSETEEYENFVTNAANIDKHTLEKLVQKYEELINDA